MELSGHLTDAGSETLLAMLGAIFEQHPSMMCVVDSSGFVLLANPAWRQFFDRPGGRSSAGAGAASNLLLNPLMLDTGCSDALRPALASVQPHSVSVDFPSPGLGSKRRRLHVTVTPLLAPHINRALMLVQFSPLSMAPGPAADTSQKSSYWLHTLINNTEYPSYIKDTQGNYLMVNSAFSQHLGRGLAVGAGLEDDALFDSPTINRLRDRDQLVVKRCGVDVFEDILVAADGSGAQRCTSLRFPVLDRQGKAFAVGNILTPQTVPQELESVVLAQNAELQLLLDSLQSAIWYMDCWGLVKLANQQARNLFPLERSVGLNFLEIAPYWDDPAERQREIMMVIRTGEPLYRSRESCQLGHRIRWFDVDKIPTKDKLGCVTGVMLVITEITDQIDRERALEESEERYRAFASSSSQAVFRYDLAPPVDISLPMAEQVRAITHNARLTECNQVMSRLFGVESADALLGTGLADSRSRFFMSDTEVFVRNGYRIENQQITLAGHHNVDSFMQVTIVGVVENGFLVRAWGSTQDVTERKRYMERLEYQARHDSLTDLPNRNFLYEEILRALDGRKDKQQLALMIIDLDRFKEINDTLGHHTGDKLLRLIGPRIQEELSDVVSVLARLGGDEFAVLLPRIRNSQHAVVIAHRILDGVGQAFDIEGYTTEISASIGIAIAPDQATDLSTLMRYADVAMYYAKTQMQGVAIYKPELDMHSPKRLALMTDLGRAIRENQLQVYFQPKVDIAAHKVYGFEALLRWHHPEMGFIPPGEFVPLAESTNLIHAMTLWVLEASIAQCSQWRRSGHAFTVAVNLSVRNLLDETLPEQIEGLLEKYQLPATALELEITESSIMADPQRALRALDKIDSLGIDLAIDDYGTGYSSLAYIKRLPVSQLKIDYSFVINMLEDQQDEIIVNSTIHLAHNLGLGVIAEGVETMEHLTRLSALGCDRAQGYLIGRPMPAAEVDKWLSKGDWC